MSRLSRISFPRCYARSNPPAVFMDAAMILHNSSFSAMVLEILSAGSIEFSNMSWIQTEVSFNSLSTMRNL